MTSEQDILQLFEDWNSALQTGDAEAVTRLYAEDAILLPTVSNQVRHNHAEIRDYFTHFLAKGPCGVIDEANVRLFDGLAINSGVYTFTLTAAGGAKVAARFTFVYRQQADGWRIIEHHSSAMPE